MLNGPIISKLIIFSIPIMLSGILQLTFNAADTIIVGRYAGSDSLAAVGSTASLINLLINSFMGLSIGVNVITAKFIGTQDQKGIVETVHTAMVVSVICGFILIFMGLLFARPMLVLMDSPENIIDKSTLYLRIYFIGMPVTMIYNFGSAVLRAFGDTKRPLIYLSVGGIVNVILNVFFVVSLGLGVAGVGLATVVSQCISAALIVRCFFKTDELYKLSLSKLKIYKPRFFHICRIGIPAGLQSTVFSFSNIIIQSSVNSFGSAVMAGNSAAASVENILYISMNCFMHTALTFCSQNLGAGKIKRIKRVFIGCLTLVTLVGIAGGFVMNMFAETLIGIYSKDAEVIKYGMIRFSFICSTYFILGVADTTTGALRGIGYSISSMLISFFCICGLRILFIYTYFQTHKTYIVLFWSYPISWVAAFVAEILVFIYGYRKISSYIKEREAL